MEKRRGGGKGREEKGKYLYRVRERGKWWKIVCIYKKSGNFHLVFFFEGGKKKEKSVEAKQFIQSLRFSLFYITQAAVKVRSKGKNADKEENSS